MDLRHPALDKYTKNSLDPESGYRVHAVKMVKRFTSGKAHDLRRTSRLYMQPWD